MAVNQQNAKLTNLKKGAIGLIFILCAIILFAVFQTPKKQEKNYVLSESISALIKRDENIYKNVESVSVKVIGKKEGMWGKRDIWTVVSVDVRTKQWTNRHAEIRVRSMPFMSSMSRSAIDTSKWNVFTTQTAFSGDIEAEAEYTLKVLRGGVVEAMAPTREEIAQAENATWNNEEQHLKQSALIKNLEKQAAAFKTASKE